MSKIIKVVIEGGGKMKVDAEGFKGKGCKEATEFLEKELKITSKGDKADLHKKEVRKCQRH